MKRHLKQKSGHPSNHKSHKLSLILLLDIRTSLACARITVIFSVDYNIWFARNGFFTYMAHLFYINRIVNIRLWFVFHRSRMINVSKEKKINKIKYPTIACMLIIVINFTLLSDWRPAWFKLNVLNLVRQLIFNFGYLLALIDVLPIEQSREHNHHDKDKIPKLA